MRTFGIGELVSPYRKEFNTEIPEKGQSTESTESTEKKILKGLPGRAGTQKTRKTRHYKKPQRPLAGGAVFLRIEQFGEARVFLEESKIFVVTRVIAIFRAQLNGNF